MSTLTAFEIEKIVHESQESSHGGWVTVATDDFASLIETIESLRVENERYRRDERYEMLAKAYTVLEVDRECWKKEAEFYKKMWGIRGKALAMPCLACGSTQKAILPKDRNDQ